MQVSVDRISHAGVHLVNNISNGLLKGRFLPRSLWEKHASKSVEGIRGDLESKLRNKVNNTIIEREHRGLNTELSKAAEEGDRKKADEIIKKIIATQPSNKAEPYMVEVDEEGLLGISESERRSRSARTETVSEDNTVEDRPKRKKE